MKIISFFLMLFLFLITAFPVNAQTQFRTDSKTVTTTVGTPPVSSSIAAAAIDLIATISPPCNGAVKGSNINCLNGLTFTNVPYATGAIGQLIQSTNANYCDDNDTSLGTCLQCVGFVQAAVMGATGKTLNKGGNAKDYATNVPDGYQYFTIGSGTPIQEGDIIIKTSPSVGHIAVVVEVLSQTAIKIAEANYDLAGAIRIWSTSPSVYNGFLRKQ